MLPRDRAGKMRIALVAPLWASVPPADYGGTELLIYWLAEGLVARGHAVTLYAAGDSRTSAVLRSVCDTNLIDRMKHGSAHHYDHYANVALAEVLKESGSYDIIHCHCEVSRAPFARLSVAPVLFSLHAALSLDDAWLLERLPEATFSAISRSQIRCLAGAAARRTVPVVYNGCDFGAYDFSASRGAYLAFLGRMGRHKNPVGAVQVAKVAGWPVVLAGKPQDPSEVSYFKREVRPLIDGEAVQYIGPVNQEQKRSFLKRAAALLFPIKWDEPFGIVMIEAMASGTPVLALNSGSVAEVVDPGITGFYADSLEQLASLVPQVMTLDRKVVREHAMRRFNHDRMVEDYIGAYRRIVAGGRNGAP